MVRMLGEFEACSDAEPARRKNKIAAGFRYRTSIGSVSSSWNIVPSSKRGTSCGGCRGIAVDGGSGSGSAGAGCVAHQSSNLKDCRVSSNDQTSGLDHPSRVVVAQLCTDKVFPLQILHAAVDILAEHGA